MVEDGSIAFTSPTQTVTVNRGQVLVIPPDVPHEAVAGSEGALLVSAVAPARRSATDYLIEG